MPEYHLPKSGVVTVEGAPVAFFSLDTFTRACIEALFWTESGNDDIAEDAGFSDLSDSALQTLMDECARFQQVNAMLLESAYQRDGYDAARAGHDFWLTRNGHGTGFWDRDALDADDLGARLAAACGWKTEFGQLDVYAGDDGKIYV